MEKRTDGEKWRIKTELILSSAARVVNKNIVILILKIMNLKKHYIIVLVYFETIVAVIT